MQQNMTQKRESSFDMLFENLMSEVTLVWMNYYLQNEPYDVALKEIDGLPLVGFQN